MRLRFLGFPHTDGPYRGPRPGTETPWEPREIREVGDEVAADLVDSFPAAFEAVGEAEVEEVAPWWRRLLGPAHPAQRELRRLEDEVLTLRAELEAARALSGPPAHTMVTGPEAQKDGDAEIEKEPDPPGKGKRRG